MNGTARPPACVIGDLSLIRALGRSGIPVAAVVRPNDSGIRLSRYCSTVIPTPGWVEEPEAAVSALIDWGRTQRQAPVLFYQGDHDLLAVSRSRDRLSAHFRFVLPPAELVEDLADKMRFAALAARLDLPVPLTRTLRRGSDLAGEVRGWRRFPSVLKPMTRSPRFAEVAREQKAIRVENRTELEGLVTVIEDYESDFILQEAIEGGEERIESYHAYVRPGGEIVGEFTGRKVRTTPRLYGHSTCVEITGEDDVRRLGRDVLEKIGFSGVLKIDFKRDARTGQLHLLEINPRFNLWHHPGAVAGVSIPALVYRDGVEPGSARPAGRARPGVRWVSFREDLRAFREYRASGEISLARWLLQVATADINESFLWRDPLPGLAGLGGTLRRRANRLLGRGAGSRVAGLP